MRIISFVQALSQTIAAAAMLAAGGVLPAAAAPDPVSGTASEVQLGPGTGGINSGGKSVQGAGIGVDAKAHDPKGTSKKGGKASSGGGSAAPEKPDPEANRFYWKLDPEGDPKCGNDAKGQPVPRIVTRWPTMFDTFYHVNGGNSYVEASGVRFSWRGFHRGVGTSRPSYDLCGYTGGMFHANVQVTLFKNGVKYAYIAVPNPGVSWRGDQAEVHMTDAWSKDPDVFKK